MSSKYVRNELNPGSSLAVRTPQTVNRPPVASHDDSVLDVGAILRVLSRRKRWIYISVLVFTALAGLVCVIMTPRYKAAATIELLKQEQGALTSVADGQTSSGATSAEDSLNFSLSLQTAVSTLESEALALRVINELNLAETKDFQYDPLIKNDDARREMALPLDKSPIKREHVLKRWTKHLKVESVPGTRAITITFTHPDPNVAAAIVNRLVADYVDYRYQVKYEAAARSADWLNSKLAGMRAQAEESAQHLAVVQKDTGIYGSDDDHNIIVARLEQLNANAADAESNRAAKEAIYKLASTGDPELVAGLVGGTTQTSGSLGTTPPLLLITLRQQESELNAEYAEGTAKYGSENPKLLQIKSKLDAARAEIKTETEKIVGRARQEYMAAVAAELAANRALDAQKRLASTMNEKTAEYGIAKHESDSAQDVYQHLLESARQTPIVEGVRSTEINIIDAATPPGLPWMPIVPLFLAAGAFFGMFVGTIAAFLRDSIDTSLRNPEDVEALTSLPVLGVIPRAESLSGKGNKKALAKAKKKKPSSSLLLSAPESSSLVLQGSLSMRDSLVMEAFRSVRTSILLSRPDNPRRVFMVTSALPGEGKSFSSLHLSSVLAQSGGKVLLVDADLRRGTLSRNIQMSSMTGLSTLLSRDSNEGNFRPVDGVPGLTFLPAGASPPNPAESLGSNKMAQLIDRWREEYDFVVIDSPPLLAVTDPAVLSTNVDGVVVVVRFAVSTQQTITRAIRILANVKAECFGILVNGVDVRSTDYKYYAGYDKVGYYGNADALPAEAAMANTRAKETA